MAEPTPTDTSTMSAVPSAVASAVGSAVGTPQSVPPMDPEERAKSINVSLADLTAKGTALYQSKKYEEASEVFSQATEMQAELNGELAPENADILFLYGRSLFKVGQSNSDVLGGKAPDEKKKNSNGATNSKAKKPQAESSTVNAPEEKTEAEQVAEEGVAIIAKNATGSGTSEAETDAKKPLFQFEGDENWEESDDEDEVEGDAQEEEEDDDLAVAFEILDLSRVLFEKRLEQLNSEKAEAGENDKVIQHIKERLADTHDLLAEISLENEKFPAAITDCRATLKYRKELYPQKSELVAEAHFKLSLALEFASVTTTQEDQGDAGPKQVDEGLRTEAADELESAIKSTQLKLENKEVELAMMHVVEDNDVTRKQIAEVKELIADMEQRLVELRKPPVDMNDALGDDNPLAGILGKALGESAAETQARVEEAKKTANDLSGLVRKKPKEQIEESNGKRKAEDAAAEEEVEAKKAKVETATES
ncbi:Uu.00g097180.m01.CDS01 [Anthostomella pinea]|uniref:Uu.00g097180.m01.CDS01 n=1 Tax=Anthostomella pinea TaxID=933095 RepID=A0AAI8VCD4_9PEZI|nr:Uu.00g097180.m01.CDS01 [Anthostomella pinea]